MGRSAIDSRTGLTLKQERFCQAYIKTGNASEAYREAYSCGKMKPESVHRLAKANLDNIKIASRIDQLRDLLQGKFEISIKTLTSDLIADREEARKDRAHRAVVAFTVELGKLHGCYDKDNNQRKSNVIFVIPEVNKQKNAGRRIED
jgi:phage terminase small subunit